MKCLFKRLHEIKQIILVQPDDIYYQKMIRICSVFNFSEWFSILFIMYKSKEKPWTIYGIVSKPETKWQIKLTQYCFNKNKETPATQLC